jgi:hypothetical protein
MNPIRIDLNKIRRDLEKYFHEHQIHIDLDNWSFEYDDRDYLLFRPTTANALEVEVFKGFYGFIDSPEYLNGIEEIARTINQQSK